jgi:ribosomal subunit interface protein
MKINIKATGIELTPAVSDYVHKKVGMIEKYVDGDSLVVAQVEVAKVTEHHKLGEVFRAEIHLTGGMDVYAAEETEDLYASIDKVKDEVISELTTQKGKQITLTRRGAAMFKAAAKGFSWGFDKLKFGKKNRDNK